MSRILLVDDAAALAELFGRAIERQGGHHVDVVVALADVPAQIDGTEPYDLALVDLSFPQEPGSGLDALVHISRSCPSTRLAIITQGDEWVASLLLGAWELLPISTVISKSAPIDYQMAAIDAVLAHGSAPPDPAIQPLLPDRRRSLRSAERFARLVQHAGHSKLWSALHDLPEPTYKSMADRTGLKLNTLKNYRAQLIDELKLHGLNDPTLRDMHLFAVRCWAFLEPFVRNVSRPS